MSTITLPNIRVGSDLQVRVRLKDGGVAIDWSTLQNIKACIYSDAQRALAGRCGFSIDEEDSTLLVCTYAANKPQYLGVNRIVISAKYMGETKTYDKPAFTFVRWTADQEGEEITIDDPDVDVEIEVEDVSSSILDQAIAAALEAAAAAEHAAHLIPNQVLLDAEAATVAANAAADAANAAGITSAQVSIADNEPGTPSAEVSLANKVLSIIFHHLKGNTGDAAGFGTITATVDDVVGDPSVTVTVSGPDTAKNFTFAFHGLRGIQGVPGVANAKYKSVDTLPTASAATMDFIYLTPSGTTGVYNMSYTEQDGSTYSWQDLGTTAIQLSDYATKAEVSQLEAKVGKITLPVTESGYYITCNAGVGNAVGAKTSAPTYCYIKQAVAEGDKIVLTGAGASAGRLWCFANANDIILSVANKNTSATNLELTAPANSAYIIINSTIAGLGVCTLLPASSLEATEKRDVGILTKSVETVAGRPVEIVKDTYTFSTDGTNNIFTFDFGETLIKSGRVDVVGDAITLVDHVYVYDEFGNIIFATGYLASILSVNVPAGTRKVSLYLRPATYPNGSPLALKMVGVLGDILKQTVQYPHIYLAESGNDVVTAYAASDQYIVGRFPVNPGTKYAFIGGAGLNTGGDKEPYVAYFDASGNQLSWYKPLSVRGTNDKPFKSAVSGFYFETPADCSWIFITVQITPSDPVVADLIPYDELTKKDGRNPLNIWVLGDSISATGYLAGNTPWEIDGDSGLTYGGIGGWISRFMEKVSVRPLKWANYSAGGYTLTDTTNDFSANSYINRLEQAIADYGNDEVSAPDILMVVGCTNDVEALPARNVTEDDISASSFSDYDNYCEYSFFVQSGGTYYANPLIPIADVNKGKIIGAMRYIVERVGTLFPNCKFVFVTPPQSSRKGIIKQMACNKDMKWGAARLCVPIIDVWSNAQMPLLWDYNADWSADNLDHRFLCDGIHTFYDPTTQDPVLGWERQGEYIANEFSRIFKFDLEA